MLKTVLFALFLAMAASACQSKLHSGTQVQSETSSELTLGSLQKFIESKNITTIDGLLASLPKNYLSEYTLVYNSRSLQDASPLFPRALVYGQTGKTVIAFNGDPKQKGYLNLEVMEFKERTREFVFQEVAFPADQRGKVQFSARNPETCLKCHGTPGRPIFDNYPTWPGIYGVKDSIIGGTKDDLNFRNFVTQSYNLRNRYSVLPGLGSVKTNDTTQTVLSLKENTTYLLQSADTTNGSQANNLGRLLLAYNYQRIYGNLKASPLYPKYKFALLAALSKCAIQTPITEFLPESLNQAMSAAGKSADQILQETSARDQSYVQSKSKRIQDWDTKEPDLDSAPDQWKQDVLKEIVPARYVLMSVNQDIQDWPMTLEFSDSLGGDQGNTRLLSALIVDDVKSEVPELANVSTVPDVDFGNGSNARALPALSPDACAALKTKSLAALSNFTLPPPPPAASVQHILSTCMECHSGADSVGPSIPFDHLTESWFEKIQDRVRARDASRMPKGQGLTDQEILLLDQRLRSCVQGTGNCLSDS